MPVLEYLSLGQIGPQENTLQWRGVCSKKSIRLPYTCIRNILLITYYCPPVRHNLNKGIYSSLCFKEIDFSNLKSKEINACVLVFVCLFVCLFVCFCHLAKAGKGKIIKLKGEDR